MGVFFSDFVDINPRVNLEKGKEYPFVEMGEVDPVRRYVYGLQKRLFKNGGTKFRTGDTLFARITPCLENGKIAQFISNEQLGFGSTEFFVFRALPNISDPSFVYYLSKTDLIRQPAEKSMTGASGRQRADLNSIVNVEVPVVSLTAQRKIAAILSAYDDLIENNLRRIKIIEEMAQNLYREWFVNFRFPGHEQTRFVDSPLGRIPKGWEVVKLGNVADVSWGDTTTTKKSYTKEGFLAFSASGPDGKLDHYDYDRTGIVLSAIGANCGLTWFAKGQWSCIKNTIRFWGINPQISTEYLYYTTYGKDFWPKRGAAQPFISQGDAKNILIIAPESTISFKFKDIASKIIDLILCLSERNNTLRQTRDMLLPKIVSGEVDVSELDIKIMDEEAV